MSEYSDKKNNEEFSPVHTNKVRWLSIYRGYWLDR